MTRRNTNNATTLARQVQAWLNALDSTGSVLKSDFDGHVADPNPHGNMKWKDEWVQGTYELFDVVRDGNWTMVANKQTQERPAPQPTGTAEWSIPDAPTWETQQYTGTVYTGVEVTIPDDRIYGVSSIRAWLPDVSPNAYYRGIIYNVNDNLFDFGETFTGDVLSTPGWWTVNIPGIALREGDNYVFVLESYNSAGTTDFNHPWVYSGTSQTGDPGLGNWNRTNQQTIVRIDYEDDDGVDRQSELSNVVPGTVIRFAEEAALTNFWEYRVNSGGDLGGYYEFEVTLLDTGGAGVGALERCQAYFSIPIATPTTYVRIVDHYLPNPQIQGYLAFDTISGGTNNENAYGIDVLVQEYTASDDWDLLALSASVSSGVSSGSAGNFIANFSDSRTLYSLVFWDRFLPVEKENLVKAMNRAPWPGGGGIPSWAEVYEYELFMNYASQYFVNVNDPFIVQAVNNLETVAIIGPGRAAIILA